MAGSVARVGTRLLGLCGGPMAENRYEDYFEDESPHKYCDWNYYRNTYRFRDLDQVQVLVDAHQRRHSQLFLAICFRKQISIFYIYIYIVSIS